MKKLSTQDLKKYGAFLALFFLSMLTAEETMAQRGRAARTARPAGNAGVVNASVAAPAAAAARPAGNAGVINASAPAVAAARPAGNAGVVNAPVGALRALPAGCADNAGVYDCGGVRYRAHYQGTEVVYVQE